MEIFVAGVVVLAVFGGTVRAFVVGQPDLATAATVFCGVFVQALPFLGLGVVISGLIAAYVSPERLARWLPRRTGAAGAYPGIGAAHLLTYRLKPIAAGVASGWRIASDRQPR